MPPEFCQYSPQYEKCKPWLKENFPQYLPVEAGSAVATSAPSAAVDETASALASTSLEEAKPRTAGGAGVADGSSDDDSSDDSGSDEDSDDKKKKTSKCQYRHTADRTKA
jgi:hypothetical protein